MTFYTGPKRDTSTTMAAKAAVEKAAILPRSGRLRMAADRAFDGKPLIPVVPPALRNMNAVTAVAVKRPMRKPVV